jgi:uncharacterized protein (TIGR02145 family)
VPFDFNTKKTFMRKLFVPLLSILLFASCKKHNPNPPPNIESVTICNQVWMKKNLDVSNYRNGDPIPQVTDPVQWANLTTGAWCYYNNDPANNDTYGKLYNWYAVNDPRGLAPVGWHVPSDSEWTVLTDVCLGGWWINAGSAMKETGCDHWLCPNTYATNSSGFTCLPGGYLYGNGTFYDIGRGAYLWSTTDDTSNDPYNAFHRQLEYSDAFVPGGIMGKPYGLSVRCLRD